MERFVIVMPVDTSAYLLPGGAGGRAGRGPDRLCEAGGREHLRRVGDSAGSDRHGRVLPDL